VPIFISLEKIMDGGTSDNLTNVSIRSLVVFGGMLKIDLANKVFYFGVNGVSIFQILKTSVFVKSINKHYPFFVGIHYMAHKCNLDVWTLSSLTFVAKIEILLLICTLFTTSPQKCIWRAAN
jgi:hypothetical protein